MLCCLGGGALDEVVGVVAFVVRFEGNCGGGGGVW